MKSALTRAAAATALVQGLAHGAMFLAAKPHNGIAEQMVLDAMRSHRFLFGGVHRSYWDMYFGYGLLAAGSCLVEAVLLWGIAPLARDNAAAFRWLAATLLAANLFHAVVVFRFFFLVPLVPDTIIAVLLGTALTVRNTNSGTRI